jgi:tRNA dimethylallyltransferase
MIVIVGATGVGKSDFALQFAQQLPIEIINADLGQFYQPLTIGTAKPAWKQEKVKHHLFDIFSKPYSCTVTEYRALVEECLDDIWQRNKIPVIVGGSTLYVESLFFELLSSDRDSKSSNRDLNQHNSWDLLKSIDPERAATIHPNDSYRINRALDIWYATGVKPSEQKPIFNPLSKNFIFLYLTRDRNELYKRINERVKLMIDAGWLDEVRSLLNTPWQTFVQEKKFIGYPDLIDFLNNPDHRSQREVLELIAQKTRNYAKRQETYWRRLEKKLYNCLVTSPGYTSNQMPKIMNCTLTESNITYCSKQLAEQLHEKK